MDKRLEALRKYVSDEKMNEVFEGTNFGNSKPRDVISGTLLKCATGYKTGRTATIVCIQLGLITSAYRLTKKGKEYLYDAFAHNCD